MAVAHDEPTLAFYNREAAVYAARRPADRNARLDDFLERLKPGAAILELGCGGGHDAAVMIAAGFEVTPTDGSPGLAAEAARQLGRPVRILRFEDLDDEGAYDAVWANACLLHVPEGALVSVLARVWRALKPGGVFYASFKAGDGGARDSLGRYYNFPAQAVLEAAYVEGGAWSSLTIEAAFGGGYDGVARTWLLCLATKAAPPGAR